MKPTRVAVLLVALAAGASWLVLRRPAGPPPPVPPAKVTAPAASRVEGRVRDEGGLPLPDASVRLFANAKVWLEGAPGCDVSLLACPEGAAGLEVLRRLDAGTLDFPQPLAETYADEHGRFSFSAVPDDAFVTWGPLQLATTATPGEPLDLQLADQLSGLHVFSESAKGLSVPVLVVSPFRRDWTIVQSAYGNVRFDDGFGWHTWAMALPDAGASSVHVPGDRGLLIVGRPRRLELSFASDAGQPGPGAGAQHGHPARAAGAPPRRHAARRARSAGPGRPGQRLRRHDQARGHHLERAG